MIGPIATLYTLCTVTTPSLYTSRIMWESIWPWGKREGVREGGLEGKGKRGRGGERERQRIKEKQEEKKKPRCLCERDREGE